MLNLRKLFTRSKPKRLRLKSNPPIIEDVTVTLIRADETSEAYFTMTKPGTVTTPPTYNLHLRIQAAACA